MGDPRKQRRKYARPTHPWKAERIEEEGELQETFGLKNKREIWRAKANVGRYRETARRVLAAPEDPEAQAEGERLVEKLNRMGIMDSDKVEDILSLTVEKLLERRLQTIVYRNGLAATPRQARQFVVHGHVLVGDQKITIPRYLIPKGQESIVSLAKDIPIDHGQRAVKPPEPAE